MLNIHSDIAPQPKASHSKGIILAVDDNHEELNRLVSEIKDLGYDPIAAHNGREALEILHNSGHEIDVLFLDRVMPVMDGMAVLREVQRDPVLRQIPVIMHAANANEDDRRAGIDAGAFHVMTGPYEASVLQHVVDEAIHAVKQQEILADKIICHRVPFDLMQTVKYRFRTMQEAEALSCFIANMFSDPPRVITGIAELMFNAVEHGNLQITFDEKKKLMQEGRWHDEITRRLHDPVLGGRVAEIAVIRKEDGIYLVVADEGEGFDWRRHIKIDPSRASDNNGRGIAHAGTVCFDSLTFNDKGNRAVAFVRRERPLTW